MSPASRPAWLPGGAAAVLPGGAAAVLLAAAAAVLLALTAYATTLPQPAPGQFGIGYGAALNRFVALGVVQAAVYAAAVVLVLRGGARASTLWPILGVAAALRLIALIPPPFLSNDMYRYIWDGWAQAAGINPYRYIPADPHLEFLRDRIVFPNINRAGYAHTIYPPAAEMVFFAASRFAAWTGLPPVLGMKLALLALEAAGIAATIRLLGRAGLPRERILIYAWNPLPVWEFASSGHLDAIAVCFIAVALLAAAAGRHGLAAAALAGATVVKFLPAVLAPAFWRPRARHGDGRFLAIFIATILLLYLPYLGVGGGVFGFLGGYAAQEGMASGQGIFLLGLAGGILPLPPQASAIYFALLALLLAFLGARIAFRAPAPTADPGRVAADCLTLGGALLVGVSAHFPWYYCWLLVPACIVARPSALYLATASILLYFNPIHSRLFWPAMVYGPYLAIAAGEIWAARRAASRRAKGVAA